MKQILFLTAIFLFSAATWAQPVQTIRGRVTDKESKTPLPGANVVLVGSNPLIGSFPIQSGKCTTISILN
jgi:hypothetical protein